MTSSKFRWGIIGLGSIANKFASGLQAIPDAELAAVASRSQEKADQFGDRYNASKRYGSYQHLAEDPDIDAVYIATPHPMHEEDTLLCLATGKAVLCEKPFAINASQATRMIAASQEHNAFLMEAMWTRFFPLLLQIKSLIDSGEIGELRMVQTDFGFRAGIDPKGRLFNPELGGGGLLDVGVYTISLASMLLGTATQATGIAHIGETGIDEQAAMVLGYSAGQLAILSTAVRTNTPQEATLLGTEGRIRIHSPWWIPTKATIVRNGKPEETLELPLEGNGYNYQAVEVARCVREGLLESPIMPHQETLDILKTMDTLRAQWGIKYPME